MRARLKDRFVELVDVDLRWGITEKEAERGEVLPICLSEIDRARPYFIGMLGERYGWVPPTEGYAADLLERQPWLRKHQGGKSVTELEILHGVLNQRRMQGRAFFYFRSPAYARAKGGHYLPSDEDRARQTELKRRIRASGLPVTAYDTPATLARRIERDLWKLLDTEFPASKVPDAFEREQLRQEAYAAPRRRLYLGGERYQAALERAVKSQASRILIEGASGGGKSALLANFIEQYRKRHPRHLVHVHYLGASADAANPQALVRRLIEFIQRATGSQAALPTDPQELLDSLPHWLATASAWVRKRRTRFILALDALNSLTQLHDLRWWPTFLPPGITLLVSCLPGPVYDSLMRKSQGLPWVRVMVRPLSQAQSVDLLQTYLARFNKKLPPPMVRQVRAHALASNPLFVRTLAEELRLFGVHEELQARLDHYLTSRTVDDLFEQVLQRVEQECGPRQVKTAMTAIWASRMGLTEKEILAIADLTPAAWAAIRHALDEGLLETGGRMNFAHDYLRIAVSDRYLPTPESRQQAHALVARWFRNRPADARRAEEEPWQWVAASQWPALRRCLTDRQMFRALEALGGSAVMQTYWRQMQEAAGVSMAQTLPRAWQRWRLSPTEQADGQLTVQVSALLMFCSHYPQALRLARRGVAMLVQSVGDDHEATLKARNTLSSIYTAMSRYREAIAENNRVLATCASPSRRRGARAVIHMDALNYAAGNAYYLGEYDRALPQFEAVLEFRMRTLGVADPATIQAVNNVANVHLESGRYEQALQLHAKNLDQARRVLGEDSPSVGLYLSNHAHALEKSGDLQGAVAGYEASIELYRRTLGSSCADLVLPLGNLGLLLQRLGEQEASYRLQSQCLHLVRPILGERHREMVRGLVNLAVVTNDLDARRSLLEQACSVGREVLGDHVMTAAALGQLGWVLSEQGEMESATRMLSDALAMLERLLPPQHPQVLDAGYQLANFYFDALDADERAIELLEKILHRQNDRNGVLASQVVDICGLAAWIYQRRESWGDARRVLEQSLACLDRQYGSDSFQHAQPLAQWAEIEVSAGHHSKGDRLFKRAVAIAEAHADDDIPTLCQILYQYGMSLEQRGDAPAALSVYERCLFHAQRRHGAHDIELANILVVVAAVREQVGDLEGALEARERVERAILALEDPDEDRIEQRAVNRAGLDRLYALTGRESRSS